MPSYDAWQKRGVKCNRGSAPKRCKAILLLENRGEVVKDVPKGGGRWADLKAAKLLCRGLSRIHEAKKRIPWGGEEVILTLGAGKN